MDYETAVKNYAQERRRYVVELKNLGFKENDEGLFELTGGDGAIVTTGLLAPRPAKNPRGCVGASVQMRRKDRNGRGVEDWRWNPGLQGQTRTPASVVNSALNFIRLRLVLIGARQTEMSA